MSWPEATFKMVEAICWMVAVVALLAAFIGIDININRKDD